MPLQQAVLSRYGFKCTFFLLSIQLCVSLSVCMAVKVGACVCMPLEATFQGYYCSPGPALLPYSQCVAKEKRPVVLPDFDWAIYKRYCWSITRCRG